jgi:hypothetical protein
MTSAKGGLVGLGVEKRLCRATVGAKTGSQAITQTARRAKSVLHRTLTFCLTFVNFFHHTKPLRR